jgi:hypothetical protein
MVRKAEGGISGTELVTIMLSLSSMVYRWIKLVLQVIGSPIKLSLSVSRIYLWRVRKSIVFGVEFVAVYRKCTFPDPNSWRNIHFLTSCYRPIIVSIRSLIWRDYFLVSAVLAIFVLLLKFSILTYLIR